MSEWITYAVGDIHGRFDLLEKALLAVDDHARTCTRPPRVAERCGTAFLRCSARAQDAIRTQEQFSENDIRFELGTPTHPHSALSFRKKTSAVPCVACG